MDQIFNKVGSYWLGQKANKEFNSVGNDINSLGSSIGEGTKWIVNKLKGKMQVPLPDLLKEYDIAVGIFPRDATHYEFDEQTKKLTVYVPQICEVGYKDSSVLRFFTTVTGYLEKGKLADCMSIESRQNNISELWSEVFTSVLLVEDNKENCDALFEMLRSLNDKLIISSKREKSKDKKAEIEMLLGSKIPTEATILPPEKCKNMGSGKRITSNKEKAIKENAKPLRKCRACGKMTNHDSRNCPSRLTEN